MKESIKASKIRSVRWVFRTVLMWKLWNNSIFWFLLAGWGSTHDLAYKINALMRSVTYGSRSFSARQCGCIIIFCQPLCYLLSLLHGSCHTKPNVLLQAKAVRMIYEMASGQWKLGRPWLCSLSALLCHFLRIGVWVWRKGKMTE